MPLEGRNGSRQPPLKRREEETDDRQLMISSTKLLGKLTLRRISQIKLHSILSYDFSRSILMAIRPFFPLVLPIEWINSWTMMKLSTPLLFGIKAA